MRDRVLGVEQAPDAVVGSEHRHAGRLHPQGAPDLETYVMAGLGQASWRFRARVTVHAPAEVIAERLPPAVTVEAVDDHTCVITAGSDTPHMLALYLGVLDADFEVTEPPELVEHIRRLGERYSRATP
ncbi:WYL domain-containing protein [Planotetraspora silvatica]|nr:WYL domain-containing protein [Planotetraspora silvatica]